MAGTSRSRQPRTASTGRGFTLVELVISIGILSLLLGVIAVPFRSVLTARTAADAGRTYAYALRDASMRAETMDSDTAWGVRVNTSNVTIFSGSSYAARTTSRDRVLGIPASVTVAGPTEIVFAKFTGAPGATGTTTFSSALASTAVGVNARGTVSVAP